MYEFQLNFWLGFPRWTTEDCAPFVMTESSSSEFSHGTCEYCAALKWLEAIHFNEAIRWTIQITGNE